MVNGFWTAVGWYKYRKSEGHPISLWRALFSEYPRFGPYEHDEEGCPQWIKDVHKEVAQASE